MMRLESKGATMIAPTTDTFSISIGSCVRYEQRDDSQSIMKPGYGCEFAKSLLVEAIDREKGGDKRCVTSLEMFNNVLKCTAVTSSYSYSVTDTAFFVMKILKHSRHDADNITYKYLIQTILKSDHDSSAKAKMLRRALNLCMEDGQICSGVIKLITRKMCEHRRWNYRDSRSLMKDCFGKGPLQISWYRNLNSSDVPPSMSDLRPSF